MSGPLIKIFSQLYVGFNPRVRSGSNDDGTWNVTPVKLAFVTPYEDNVAGKKRMATVDSWSKERIGGKWVPKEGGGQVWKTDPRPEGFEPVIIDNKPMVGFKLAEEVRRTYWGGGNVVWRIESPLGWEFEISSSNLARIITDCGIAAGGEIQGKCIFGRMGKDNILIPEGSDLWKQSVKDAETLEKLSKTVASTQVVSGSICKMKNGDVMTYAGRFYVTTLEMREIPTNKHNYYSSSIIHPSEVVSVGSDTKTEQYHAFIDSDNKYYKERTMVVLYKEKRVIEVTGNDPEWADYEENQKKMNSPKVKATFAGNRDHYCLSGMTYTIRKPVACYAFFEDISVENIQAMILQSMHSEFIRFGFPECTERSALIINQNGDSLKSVALYGKRIDSLKNGTQRYDSEGRCQNEYERNSIKVIFVNNYTISSDTGMFIRNVRTFSRDWNLYYARNDIMLDGVRYNLMGVQNTYESDVIAKQVINDALTKFSGFKIGKFAVTTISDHVESYLE
jgi:hypothetical protein